MNLLATWCSASGWCSCSPRCSSEVFGETCGGTARHRARRDRGGAGAVGGEQARVQGIGWPRPRGRCSRRRRQTRRRCGRSAAEGRPARRGPSADLDARPTPRAWGRCPTRGRPGIGVERVYVVDGVYRPVPREAQRAGLAACKPGDGAMPPSTCGRADAARAGDRRGGAAPGRRGWRGGGRAWPTAASTSLRAPFVQPVVLVDVPEESARAVREVDVRPGRAPSTPVPTLAGAARLRERLDVRARVGRVHQAALAGDEGGAGPAGGDDAGELGPLVRSCPALRRSAVPGESGFGRIYGGRGYAEFSSGQADHQAADEAAGGARRRRAASSGTWTGSSAGGPCPAWPL